MCENCKSFMATGDVPRDPDQWESQMPGFWATVNLHLGIVQENAEAAGMERPEAGCAARVFSEDGRGVVLLAALPVSSVSPPNFVRIPEQS